MGRYAILATARCPKIKKPTIGFITEVGCLRFVLLSPYRAFTPHTGALPLQQQMQTPMVLIRFTEEIIT
jgi:hypothetical protein